MSRLTLRAPFRLRFNQSQATLLWDRERGACLGALPLRRPGRQVAAGTSGEPGPAVLARPPLPKLIPRGASLCSLAADDQAPGQAPGLRARRRARCQGACVLPVHRLGEAGAQGDPAAVQAESREYARRPPRRPCRPPPPSLAAACALAALPGCRGGRADPDAGPGTSRAAAQRPWARTRARSLQAARPPSSGKAPDAAIRRPARRIVAPVFVGSFLGRTLWRAASKSVFGPWQIA